MTLLKFPRLLSATAATAGLFLLPAGFARGAVTFNFNYLDATWSPAAKTSLNNAVGVLASYFPAYTATITMDVTGSNAAGDKLAEAGSLYQSSGVAGFSNLGVIGKKIQSNGAIDQTGAGADGSVDANFFHAWAFGDVIGPGQFDFTTVMIHELSHALGFASMVKEDGTTEISGGVPGEFTPFDQYLTNGQGVSLVDPGTFSTGAAWNTAKVGGTGTVPATPDTGLYFAGPNAKAANGGSAVPLYSPTTWGGPSSGSHLDTDYYTEPNRKIMSHAVNPGPAPRGFSPIELGIWQDLGYTVVPEPSASLLLGSMGLLALGCRSRRSGQGGA